MNPASGLWVAWGGVALAWAAGLAHAQSVPTPTPAPTATTPANAPISAAHTDSASAWRAGNEAFRASQFANAVLHYRRALSLEGERASAAGHYNLGTAYYRLGRFGEAILHLQKALRLSPRMSRARANLAIVERHVELDKGMQEIGIAPLGFGARFVHSFTAHEAAIVFLAIYYAFFGLLLGRRFAGGTLRAALTVGTIVFSVLTLGSGGLFAYRAYQDERAREAVVLEAKAPLMEPHRGEWKSVRALPLGLRVRIESQNEQWVKIRLRNGLSGYVKNAQVGAI